MISQRTLGATALVAGGVLVLLTLAVARDLPAVVDLDRAWGTAAHDLTADHDTLRRFWLADAIVQGGTVLQSGLLLLALALLVARHVWTALTVVITVVVTTAASTVAKSVLERPRPTWGDPVTVIGGFSYPSGHALGGAMFTVTVALVAFQLTRGRWRVVVLVLASVADLVVSADRVFLGVHYVSDVVAGNLLGVALVTSTWLTLDVLRQQRGRRQSSS